MKTFQAQLKSIRLREERRLRARPRQSDQQLGIGDGFDRYLSARDEFVQDLQELAEDLCAEMPAFSVQVGFTEGRQVLTVSALDHAVDDQGRRVRRLTRFTFFLSAYRADGALEVESRITVFDRGLKTEQCRLFLADADGLAQGREFAKRRILEGAAVFVARQGRRAA